MVAVKSIYLRGGGGGWRFFTIKVNVSKELCGGVVFTTTKVDGAISSRGRFRCLYLIIEVLVIYYV